MITVIYIYICGLLVFSILNTLAVVSLYKERLKNNDPQAETQFWVEGVCAIILTFAWPLELPLFFFVK